MRASVLMSIVSTVSIAACAACVPETPVDPPDDPPAPLCIDDAAGAEGRAEDALLSAPAAESEIDAVIASGRAAAAGVGVARGDAIVWLHAAGAAQPALDRAATVDTPFMLASVTKTVVATLILQLVEDGALDLDVDVGVQAPVLARVRNPSSPDAVITPRMLLTHTSTLYDVPATFDATWATSGDSPVAMRDFVAGYFDPDSVYSGGADMWWPNEPGQFSCYSNMGMGVLGVLAEEVSGLSLEELAQTRIFQPLGMTHTSFRADVFCADVLARGVRAEGGGFVDDNLGAGAQPEGHPELASGMLKSSARDLLVFAAAIANGGVYDDARVLSETTVATMLTRQLDASLEACGDGRSDPAQQALGFTHFPDPSGADWVGHYGGMNGASSAMWFLSRSDDTEAVAYVAMTNVADVSALFDIERSVVTAIPSL
jgi:CubicO group peptidase (beta-lactamase class C family)